ncbi:CAP domain-containing protein [Massilia sp. NP310]|jgi:uncharacterized protein YkwD|uniref:CAP domain-containing protein n=1 Tax=Massilia sp. NP310 TaxID=2861282 RepID=UPI001C6332EE|nr:CAP domain-containing protein [Massilia sp. NP310]QYG00159.1 CAP domain-containing protein [Massilia sp. NP310]
MRVSKVSLVATLAAIVLSGCGGGSGDKSPVASNPIAPVVTNPIEPVAPTPTPTLTPQAASLQTAAAPTYAAGSSEAKALQKLNAFRTVQGLGPVNQNANADIAAKNHAAYVTANQSGASPHEEVVGKPGFTGVDVLSRLIAAGYPATGATEVIAFSIMFPNDEGNAIDNLANTVYHRAAMMNQGLTAVGIAPENPESPLYVNIGRTTPQINAGDYVGVYPANNQTGVWLSHSVESPNPFYQEMEMTQENMCTKTSTPVSLTSEASTILNVTSFTVTEEGQTAPLDARLITKATSTQDNTYLTPNVAFLVGKASFKPNTKYNVRFIGKATGAATGSAAGLAIDKSWTFTTGAFKRGC